MSKAEHENNQGDSWVLWTYKQVQISSGTKLTSWCHISDLFLLKEWKNNSKKREIAKSMAGSSERLITIEQSYLLSINYWCTSLAMTADTASHFLNLSCRSQFVYSSGLYVLSLSFVYCFFMTEHRRNLNLKTVLLSTVSNANLCQS